MPRMKIELDLPRPPLEVNWMPGCCASTSASVRPDWSARSSAVSTVTSAMLRSAWIGLRVEVTTTAGSEAAAVATAGADWAAAPSGRHSISAAAAAVARRRVSGRRLPTENLDMMERCQDRACQRPRRPRTSWPAGAATGATSTDPLLAGIRADGRTRCDPSRHRLDASGSCAQGQRAAKALVRLPLRGQHRLGRPGGS